jgi:hypothetical protein
MKIHFIIALLVSLVIVGFLVYKILKANNLLIPFKEFKKRWRIEGETVYTWTYTPPFWQRISGFLALPLWLLSGLRRIEICFNQEDKRVPQLIKDYTDKKNKN